MQLHTQAKEFDVEMSQIFSQETLNIHFLYSKSACRNIATIQTSISVR